MQILVEKMVYGGKGFAKLDGKVIFLEGAIPGETVEAEITKDKKDYAEAKVVRIITPSANRVKERCPHYKICSPYQSIEYPFQLKIKEGQVREALQRFLGNETYEIRVRPAEQIWNYRNKVSLHVLWEKDEAFFAYHKSGSRENFIKIEECFLVSKEINALLGEVKKTLGSSGMSFVDELVVRENSDKKQFLIVLYGEKDLETPGVKDSFKELTEKFPVTGIVYINKKNYRRLMISGKAFLEEKIDGKIFRIGPESFFQVNIGMLDSLIRDLKEELNLKGEERILDLYAGGGLFSVIFAPQALEIRAVEAAKENISFFKKNIELNESGNVTIYEGSCEEWMEEVLNSPIDILIADPPRKGFSDAVLEAIKKKKPVKVAYISCDISTLARDLKRLSSAYAVEKIYIYDFFPHTAHIETLVMLRYRT